jgi:site-specific recombinase XerD
VKKGGQEQDEITADPDPDLEEFYAAFLLEYGSLTEGEFRAQLQDLAGALDPAVQHHFRSVRRADTAFAKALAALPWPDDNSERQACLTATEAWLTAGRSRRTRRAYLRDLETWLSWLRQRGLHPRQAQREDLEAYLGDLGAGRPLAASTIDRRLSALSSWYTCLADNGIVTGNPVRAVARPSTDRRASSTVGLTPDEVGLLLQAADAAVTETSQWLDPGHPRPRAARRDRVLLGLLAELGLGVSEATGLSVADLQREADGWMIIIHGRGSRIRKLGVPAGLLRHLEAFVAERRRALAVDRLQREFAYGQPGDSRELRAELTLLDRLPPAWSGDSAEQRLAELAARPRALDPYMIYRTKREHIEKLTAEELAMDQPTGLLFATASGNRLSQAHVFALVRRLARAAALPAAEKISPHSLRRTVATAVLGQGGSLREVQGFLGHSDPRTTLRYSKQV